MSRGLGSMQRLLVDAMPQLLAEAWMGLFQPPRALFPSAPRSLSPDPGGDLRALSVSGRVA